MSGRRLAPKPTTALGNQRHASTNSRIVESSTESKVSRAQIRLKRPTWSSENVSTPTAALRLCGRSTSRCMCAVRRHQSVWTGFDGRTRLQGFTAVLRHTRPTFRSVLTSTTLTSDKIPRSSTSQYLDGRRIREELGTDWSATGPPLVLSMTSSSTTETNARATTAHKP
jgi:hypothetical protein